MPIYMSIPGVPGRISSGKYAEWIELLSVQFDLQNGRAGGGGSGSGVMGAHSVRSGAASSGADVIVGVPVGPEAVQLVTLSNKGVHINPVVIDYLHTPKSERHVRLVLRDVVVTQIQIVETLVLATLNYTSLIAHYSTPAKAGSPGSTTPVAVGTGKGRNP